MTHDREIEDGLDAILGRSNDHELTEFRLVDDLEKAGKRLVIEHRQKAPPLEPVKRAAPAVAHHFTDFRSLADYLVRYGAPGNVLVLADCEAGEIGATIDEKSKSDPEQVSYKPLTTPDWQLIGQHLNKPLSAKAFARFCRRLRPLTSGATEAELRLLAGQISVAKKLEEHTGNGTKGTYGHILRIEAKGGDGKQLQVPELIKVTVEPFMDSMVPIEMELFIDLEPKDDGVFFVIDCPDSGRSFDTHVEQILQFLQSNLGPVDALVGLGRLHRRDWRYLE